MSTRERLIHTEEIGPGTLREDGTDVLTVKVCYHEGGLNYFHGTHTNRGYRLLVSYHTRRPDGTSTSLLGQSGVAKLLAPATRFSAKMLAAITPTPEDIAALRAQVLALRAKNAHLDPDTLTR